MEKENLHHLVSSRISLVMYPVGNAHWRIISSPEAIIVMDTEPRDHTFLDKA